MTGRDNGTYSTVLETSGSFRANRGHETQIVGLNCMPRARRNGSLPKLIRHPGQAGFRS